MRVLFRTERVPTTFTFADGRTCEGGSFFELLLSEPWDDGAEPGTPRFRPLSRWREDGGPGQPLRMSPPPAFGGARAIEVPDAVIANLRDAAPLAFHWTWTPDAAPVAVSESH